MHGLRVLGMLTPEQRRALIEGQFLVERPESWHRVAGLVEQVKQFDPQGRGYFDRLDSALQFDGDIHRWLLDKAQWVAGPRAGVITSGHFGDAHYRWSRANRAGRLPLVLRGGLRYEPRPEYNSLFREYQRRMMGVREWVFIDDSLYAGRTADWARELVLMTGGRWHGAVVAYDGSHEQRKDVHSLYRYFDHHPLPE